MARTRIRVVDLETTGFDPAEHAVPLRDPEP